MHEYKRKLAVLLVCCMLSYGFACSASDVSKVKKKVADAAAILNTAAKSNRSLYQSGVYGAVGSSEAIQKRQKVATAVHQANEWLSLAVERAANLTASDLPSGKTDIIALLQKAVTAISSLQIDNQNMQLVLQSAAAAINAAIVLTQAIREVN